MALILEKKKKDHDIIILLWFENQKTKIIEYLFNEKNNIVEKNNYKTLSSLPSECFLIRSMTDHLCPH